MLGEYEKDHHTGMFPQAVAEEICAYTSGYPVLVSGICKYIDEDISNGLQTASLRRGART